MQHLAEDVGIVDPDPLQRVQVEASAADVGEERAPFVGQDLDDGCPRRPAAPRSPRRCGGQGVGHRLVAQARPRNGPVPSGSLEDPAAVEKAARARRVEPIACVRGRRVPSGRAPADRRRARPGPRGGGARCARGRSHRRGRAADAQVGERRMGEVHAEVLKDARGAAHWTPRVVGSCMEIQSTVSGSSAFCTRSRLPCRSSSARVEASGRREPRWRRATDARARIPQTRVAGKPIDHIDGLLVDGASRRFGRGLASGALDHAEQLQPAEFHERVDLHRRDLIPETGIEIAGSELRRFGRGSVFEHIVVAKTARSPLKGVAEGVLVTVERAGEAHPHVGLHLAIDAQLADPCRAALARRQDGPRTSPPVIAAIAITPPSLA